MTDGMVMDVTLPRIDRTCSAVSNPSSSPRSLEHLGNNEDQAASSAACLLATLRNSAHRNDAVSFPMHGERERGLVEQRRCNFSPIVPTRSSGSCAIEEDPSSSPSQSALEILRARLVPLPCICPGLTRLEATIRRPPSRDRWGLFVAVFDSAHLIVGATLDGRCDCGPSCLAGEMGPVEGGGSNGGDAGGCRMSIHPGDVVISLNGMAISQLKTLGAVTAYLGSVREIDVVVLRHPAALRAAGDVLRADGVVGGGDGMAPDGSGRMSSARAAEAAHGVMRGVLDRFVRLGGCQHPEQVSPTVPPLVTEYGPMADPGGSESALGCQGCSAPGDITSFVHSRSSAFSVVAPGVNRQSPSPLTVGYRALTCDGAAASSSSSAGGQPPPRLLPREDFEGWLRARKALWRIQRGVRGPDPGMARKVSRENSSGGNTLSFSELVTIMDPERDGTRARQFMDTLVEENFPQWLSARKSTWRKRWDVRATSPESVEIEVLPETEFWRSSGGFADFGQWLASRQGEWRRGYSWHVRKRKRLEIECEQVVGLPAHPEAPGADECFSNWLRIRRNQWKIMRRKRQRRLQDEAIHHSTESALAVDSETSNADTKVVLTMDAAEKAPSLPSLPPCVPTNHGVLHSSEIQQIDELLEEQERRQRELDCRPPMDISFIFDARLGAPDDVICYCLRFLHPSEHGKVLCISKSTSDAMKERADMWRNLCPSHWRIPRRARKPWHSLYFVNLRKETEEAMKRSDEVLTAAARIVSKADQLHKLEKLVKQAEKKFSFSVDYVSSVVLERNSILNIAVIHQRHKIVKWLVEAKGADIETCDRGQFTPLLNAAWGGDKYLVRFLLSHGADRAKVGTGHSSQRLAPADFEGMNAEGWAKERGHHNLAELLRLGLA